MRSSDPKVKQLYGLSKSCCLYHTFAKQLLSNFETWNDTKIKQFLGLGPSQVAYKKKVYVSIIRWYDLNPFADSFSDEEDHSSIVFVVGAYLPAVGNAIKIVDMAVGGVVLSTVCFLYA